jgi:hypothetical protein
MFHSFLDLFNRDFETGTEIKNGWRVFTRHPEQPSWQTNNHHRYTIFASSFYEQSCFNSFIRNEYNFHSFNIKLMIARGSSILSLQAVQIRPEIPTCCLQSKKKAQQECSG